jgi:hypothetical protein
LLGHRTHLLLDLICGLRRHAQEVYVAPHTPFTRTSYVQMNS